MFLYLLFVSCADKNNNNIMMIQKIQNIKVRFINAWGGRDANSDTLQMIFNEFEKEDKNVEIVNESIFGEDF